MQFPFRLKPIFDPIFGRINPVGGGAPDPPPSPDPAPDPPPNPDPAPDPSPDPDPDPDPAPDPDPTPDPKDKELDELRAQNKKLEEEKEAKRLEDLSELDREKALRIKAEETSAANQLRADQNELEAAVSSKVARLASEGKILIPEFIPQVAKKEDIDKAFDEAFKRQETVKKGWRDGSPNLPPGGQPDPVNNHSVPAEKIAEFKRVRAEMRRGNRTRRNELAYNALRRELQAAKVNPASIKD